MENSLWTSEFFPYQLVQMHFIDQLLKPLPLKVLKNIYSNLHFIESTESDFTIVMSGDWDLPYLTFKELSIKTALRMGKKLGFFVDYSDPSKLYDTTSPDRLINYISEIGIPITIFIRANILRKKKIVNYIKRLVQNKLIDFGYHVEPNFIVKTKYDIAIKIVNNIEQIINEKIIAGRNHTLYFDPIETWSFYSKIGLKLSSNLGFNNSLGFPYGIPYAFHTPYEVIEVPQVLMDVCLWRDLHADIYTIKRIIEKLCNNMKRVQALAAVNFHLDYANYDYQFKILKELIASVKKFKGIFINFNYLLKII